MESSGKHSINNSPSPSPTSNPADKGKRLREEGDDEEIYMKNKKMKEGDAEGRSGIIICVFCEGRFSTLSNLLLHLQSDHSSSLSDDEQPSSAPTLHHHHAFDLNRPIDKAACGDHVDTTIYNHNQHMPNHNNISFDLNQLPPPDEQDD